MLSTQKIAADWLSKSARFQAFPPCLKFLEEEEVFKQQFLFSKTERLTWNANTFSGLVLGVLRYLLEGHGGMGVHEMA